MLLTNNHTGARELTPLRPFDSSDHNKHRTMNSLAHTATADAPTPPPAFKLSDLHSLLHAFDAVARLVFATMFLTALTTVYVQMDASALEGENAMST